MGIETIVIGVLFAASSAVAYSGYQKAKKAAKAAMERTRGMLYQTRSTAEARRIIYGVTRVGGLEAYVATSGTKNEYLHFILIWGEGPCYQISQIQFDGVGISLDGSGNATGDYAGFVTVKHALGDPDQNAIADAVANMPGWTDTDRLRGICHSWVRLKFDEDVFPNGVPSISAILWGRNDVYDPRGDTTGWTDNVALCMNHYMCLPKLGPGLTYADEVGEDELIAAANACDEDVDLLAGGTEARYRINGIISLESETEEIIETFRTIMAGFATYVGGRFRIYAGVYETPTFTITKNMIVSPIKERTRKGKRDRINVVRGVFAGPDVNYFPTSFLPYYNQNYIDADKSELQDDLDLSPVPTESRCRRIAKIHLERSRKGRQLEFEANVECMRAQPGLPVLFDFPEIGYDEVPMDVLSYDLVISERDIRVKLRLQETGPDVFAWDETVDEQTNVTIAGTASGVNAPDPDVGLSTEGILGGLTFTDLP